MSLWSRIASGIRRIFASAVEPPEPTEPPTEPGRRRLPGEEPRGPRREGLPPGWQVEGLYYHNRPEAERRVTTTDPSDAEIMSADAIVVSYTDALGKDYRTIHGAEDLDAIGDLIAAVIEIESPVRSSR